MALNGAGQTVDLDATTLDVDATTITVDATTTTFTGDVKGPRSTGDDEFVTYAQLDSMANMAPFNETYKTFKYPGGTAQKLSWFRWRYNNAHDSFEDDAPALNFLLY